MKRTLALRQHTKPVGKIRQTFSLNPIDSTGSFMKFTQKVSECLKNIFEQIILTVGSNSLSHWGVIKYRTPLKAPGNVNALINNMNIIT